MNIRLRGFVLIVVGVGLFSLLYSLLAEARPGRGQNSGAVKVAAWFLVLAIVGATEFISGYAFYQVAQKWDTMPVVIRYLLGLVVIALAFPLILLLIRAFVS